MVDIKIGVKVDGSFLYFSARCGTIDQLKLAITRQFPMIDDTRLIFYYEGEDGEKNAINPHNLNVAMDRATKDGNPIFAITYNPAQ